MQPMSEPHLLLQAKSVATVLPRKLCTVLLKAQHHTSAECLICRGTYARNARVSIPEQVGELFRWVISFEIRPPHALE